MLVVQPNLSIIIPVFNEEENVLLMYEKIQTVFEEIDNHSFEINFVNDNSTDKTWDLIRELNSKDPKVKGTKPASYTNLTLPTKAKVATAMAPVA